MEEPAKLMYVEDEPFLAKIVMESLERKGYNVRLVNDGHKAISIFKEFHPDICILDIMLPGKDGFMIASDIRKLDAELPIIFLTAKKQTADVVAGFNIGGNDYLKKPFSLDELLARINNLLWTHKKINKQKEVDTYQLGSFTFLPLRYQLVRKKKTIKLSHREVALLKMLISGRGKPVLRKEILMKIWGDDSYFNSRNLDVYIRKLRKHFSVEPAIHIITLKGVGYDFVVQKDEDIEC